MRSSKVKRLTRLKKGFYQPPSKPIFVPGLHWLGLVLVGLGRESGPPLLAHLGTSLHGYGAKDWSGRPATGSTPSPFPAYFPGPLPQKRHWR
jgi:hypothetical protein